MGRGVPTRLVILGGTQSTQHRKNMHVEKIHASRRHIRSMTHSSSTPSSALGVGRANPQYQPYMCVKCVNTHTPSSVLSHTHPDLEEQDWGAGLSGGGVGQGRQGSPTPAPYPVPTGRLPASPSPRSWQVLCPLDFSQLRGNTSL